MMKHTITALLYFCISIPLSGQIHGNGKMVSITEILPDLNHIDVQFNADIILDYEQAELMTITADENVMKYIGIYFEEGTLKLDQIQWIEPSKLPTIVIGSPNLLSVFQGTHSTTRLVNVQGPQLRLEGNVGKIIAQGGVNNLTVNTTRTSLDLKNLTIGTIRIRSECKSKIILNAFENLQRNEDSQPKFIFLDPENTEYVENKVIPKKVEYIQFKIKNNSIKRNSFYVSGPNGRGGNFSYGFSMLPFGRRTEKWSVGSKVYKQNRSGKLTELCTVTKENEGETIKLF